MHVEYSRGELSELGVRESSLSFFSFLTHYNFRSVPKLWFSQILHAPDDANLCRLRPPQMRPLIAP